MNRGRWRQVFAIGLLVFGLLATPSLSQEDLAVTLRAAKYSALVEAVAQNRGKVVVVDLWAFFCQPCKENFPHLVQLHQKYADKGMTAISVSLDPPENRAKAQQFLLKNGAKFTNLWLDEPPQIWTERFHTNSIPCVFVFDRRGRWTQLNGSTHDQVERLVLKLLTE